MKKLFTILLLVATFAAFGQDSTGVDVLKPEEISTFERVVDKYSTNIYNTVSEGFNTVVDTVTPVAIEGFKIAVRLQIAKGIVNILPLIFFFILCIWYYNYYHKILDKIERSGDNDKYSEGPYSEDQVTPFLILFPISILITGVLAILCTYEGVLYLMAPEWFAIQDIIAIFK